MQNCVINSELLRIAKTAVSRMPKQSFMDAAALGAATGGAQPGAAPPGAPPQPPLPGMSLGGMPPDPAAAGGAPPMDPATGGMPPDPMAGGSMPPPDPMAGGAMVTPDMVKQMIQDAMSQNGGGGGGMASPKKKIDVNTEMYQIKKILVLMASAMGMQLPPTILLGDPAEEPTPPPTSDPAASSGAPAPPSIIPPIDPMAAAGPGMEAPGGAPKQGSFAWVGHENMSKLSQLAAATRAIRAAGRG